MARIASLWRIPFLFAFLAILSSTVLSSPFWPLIDESDTLLRRAESSVVVSPISTPSSLETTITPTTTTPLTTTPTTTPTVTNPLTTTPTTTQQTTPTTKQQTTPTLITTSTPVIEQSTVLITQTVQATDPAGNVVQSTLVSSMVMSSTASFASSVQTNPALTGSGSGSSGGSGLSDSSKKIIGGVVGGIGGAALLAGILFVAIRYWNKDRYNPDDDLDFAAGTGQGLSNSGAKEGSTLASDDAHGDRYNTMSSTGRPNAAANF